MVLAAHFLGELPTELLPLLLTVFSASLVGSLHCVGMCGPFVAVYSAGEKKGEGASDSSKIPAHLSYHLGRALTYVGLGALGGSLGAAVDWAGEAAGLVQAAAWISGGLVILWGLGVLLPGLRVRTPVDGLLGRQLVKLGTKPRVVRASLLGVFTPLLPCGWLYAFVLTAAGTGSLLRGSALMFAFWLGTVPALLGMGAVVARLGDSLRKRLPLLTGAALIVVGLFGVVSRARMAPPQSPPEKSGEVEKPSCH